MECVCCSSPDPKLYPASRPRPRAHYGIILRPSADTSPIIGPTDALCFLLGVKTEGSGRAASLPGFAHGLELGGRSPPSNLSLACLFFLFFSTARGVVPISSTARASSRTGE